MTTIESLEESNRQYNVLHKECYEWKAQYHSACNELAELRIRESVLSFLLHQSRKNWCNKFIVIGEDGEYHLSNEYDEYSERCLGIVSDYL